MKIDFHCHTMKTKNSEPDTRNVTLELFKEKVLQSEVKVLAITNHNYFDYKQYKLFKDSVSEYCQVWPGVEFDVIGKSGSSGHILIISNPKEDDNFNNIMLQILKAKDANTFKINADELLEKTKDLDLIYVAHYIKDNALSIEDINDIESKLKNKNRLFKEPSSLSSVSVLQSNNQRVIIGTDVKDWNKYEECKFGEFKFEFKDFLAFTKIIEKDIPFIEGLINEKLIENVKVYGKSDRMECPFSIPIYSDVNIIFGDRGSGKSQIISSLEKYYKNEKNLEPLVYNGGDQDEWKKKLLSVNEDEYNINYLGISDDQDGLINEIIKFKDTNPSSIKTYIDFLNITSKNRNRDRMLCLKVIKDHLYSPELYDKKYIEHKKIASFLKDFKTFSIKKTLIQESNDVEELLELLYYKSFDIAKNEWINQKSIYLFNDFIENISLFVSENTGTPKVPLETGFAAYAKNRIKMKKNIDILLSILNMEPKSDMQYIGGLGNKGNVSLEKIYNFVNYINIKNIDYKTLLVSKGNVESFLKNIKNINLNVFTGSIAENVNDLNNGNIKSLSQLLSIQKRFTINGIPYEPSKGETSILCLQNKLISEKNKGVYLIDEPELGLSNIYINDNIVPLIKDLINAKKIVVIATHDANIAVRTRPLNSILKITNNNNYTTYTGNMFTDKLVNIHDKTDVLSWKEYSVKYLEGGINAFYERGELYE